MDIEEMEQEPEESVMDKLPLPKLEAYYEAPKKHYWLRDSHGVWIQVSGDAVIKRLDALGYNSRPAKGKKYSEADHELERIRMEDNICYAGAVAGNMAGVVQTNAGKYLVTRSPKMIDPKQGDWRTIHKLGTRLFGPEQFEYVLGWSKNAISGLVKGGCRRGQLLVLAGPPGCGKSFWQNRIVTPLLGGRVARPGQFMSGGTTFNADIISSEHLMLEDENYKTDQKSRAAFASAIKGFAVNTTQRVHGKGDNGFLVESSHWVTMSVNDDAEALAIMPPLEKGVVDKLQLHRCKPAITEEWPGDKAAIEALEATVEAEMPAFVHYLLNEHVINPALRNDRYGIKEYLNHELVEIINGTSPSAQLEFLIDGCWPQLAKEGKELKLKSEEIQLELTRHPDLGRMASNLLNYPKACGRYLNDLADQNPNKFIRPSEHARPRIWTIRWADAE